VSVRPYRCPTCGKLLFKSDAEAGRVETRCRTCKVLRTINVRAPPAPQEVKAPTNRLTPANPRA
jgi:phage FluMu protein Com